MYAIVDIAGKQFKVEANKYVYAPLMEGPNGTQVSFDKVLLIDDGASVSVGTPVIKGASISGKIMEHVKGDKEIVFKKKRRKGYAKKNGHRQQYTRVMIESISSK
jgi:large subunit ribosomal protein L21